MLFRWFQTFSSGFHCGEDVGKKYSFKLELSRSKFFTSLDRCELALSRTTTITRAGWAFINWLRNFTTSVAPKFFRPNEKSSLFPGEIAEIALSVSSRLKTTVFDLQRVNWWIMPLAPPWVPVDFYFTDSNIIIPHSALKGATPEEMFTGTWTLEKIKEINERITMAKLLRIESNTSSRCEPCIA